MARLSDNAPSGIGRRRNLVSTVAEGLRQRVFDTAPNELIGSLPDLAQAFDVGIVTMQQAARILEHEGLLDVRRGPRGGYYGRRPDSETIERALAAYMRMHPDSYGEALDITSLLFIELCGAAAECTDLELRRELSDLSDRFTSRVTDGDLGELETQLQNLLFRMVDRPIFEMLTRVTLSFATAGQSERVHGDATADDEWLGGRRRIMDAICASDRALARFEADRSNRQLLLSHLRCGGTKEDSNDRVLF